MIDPRSLPAVLARLAGAGLVGVGAAGIAFPRPLAQSFGTPLNDTSAAVFVRATGARDVALGGIVMTASLRGERDVLLAAIAACFGISIADFCNAFFSGDRKLRARYAVHAGGAAYFAAILALSIRRLR